MTYWKAKILGKLIYPYVLLCHIISCALYCRAGREPSLHESLSKQDAQRSDGIRNVALSALDCPAGCNPEEGQAARVQGSFLSRPSGRIRSR